MPHTFIISGHLPGLNEYIDACRRHAQIGGRMKREHQDMVVREIMCAILSRRFPAHIDGPVRLRYRFVEPNKRRDKDNISGFAHKVIQDALVQVGVLKGDGWGYVEGSMDEYEVDKERPRIEVTVEEVEKDG